MRSVPRNEARKESLQIGVRDGSAAGLPSPPNGSHSTPIRFASLDRLRKKRGTPEMPSSDKAAAKIMPIIERVPQLVESGAYADIRQPPLAGMTNA